MIVAGIDIGSVYTKSVLLDGEKLISFGVLATGVNYESTAREIIKRTLQKIDLSSDGIGYVVTSGYGRRSVSFGNRVITELSAACLGAEWVRRRGKGLERIRTIIDLGGQDTKVILLDDSGRMQDFLMNDKCAAGTGRFLEVMARALEIKIEELAELSSRAKEPVTINSTCTVFAESEVISLLAQGRRKEDIIAGIHSSIAGRIINMVRKLGEKDQILFSGGGARNSAIAKEIEKKLLKKVYIPEHPQLMVAIGAARSREIESSKPLDNS